MKLIAQTYWHPEFWGELGRAHVGSAEILPNLPPRTTYSAIGDQDGIDGLISPGEAVGAAMTMFRAWPWRKRTAWVSVDTPADHPWSDARIFIVSASKAELDRLIREWDLPR